MRLRVLVTLLVVVGMAPIATAGMVPTNSPDAANASVGTGQLAQPEDASNYTKLYVESDGGHFDLKPGESDEFDVTVTNAEEEAVTVDPHLYAPPTGERVIDESWVSIDAADATIDAGEERTFTVTVSVPDDAELGHYRGQIAFTDETVTYPGRPARPVHAVHFYTQVWREPTVRILSGGYMHSQVESGDSTTHQVVIKNDGDESVPLSPELMDEQRRHHRGSQGAVDPSWIDIDAPNEIAPGETATVSITLSPPESADRGRYDTQIDLGLKDPNRDERNSYWQQINLNFEVWKQPAEPFETSFTVSEATENLTLELSSQSPNRHGSAASETPSASFDVQFVSPDGEVIDAERVSVTDTGYVDLSGEMPGVGTDDYGVRGGSQSFDYRLDDPAAGEWSVRITPHNTVGFSYQIVRNESTV